MSRHEEPRDETAGRRLVCVIGIDRYRSWPRLRNAVSDARGALRAFLQLGFELVIEPMIDEAATGAAIRSLAVDGLSTLSKKDSLILFFAGHGYTITQTFEDGDSVKTGFIIPVDGDTPDGSKATWIRLDTWLSDVARLPARHILVFLDACHSGIALGSLVTWRGANKPTNSLAHLARRRSRRVITSALDDQQALDSGPVPDHSLFTGCLLEALDGSIAPDGAFITGTELGLYLQKQVMAYPGSQQTPDFGALERDKRGDLVIQLATSDAGAPVPGRDGEPIAAPVIVGPQADRWGHRSTIAAMAVAVAGVALGGGYAMKRSEQDHGSAPGKPPVPSSSDAAPTPSTTPADRETAKSMVNAGASPAAPADRAPEPRIAQPSVTPPTPRSVTPSTARRPPAPANPATRVAEAANAHACVSIRVVPSDRSGSEGNYATIVCRCSDREVRAQLMVARTPTGDIVLDDSTSERLRDAARSLTCARGGGP